MPSSYELQSVIIIARSRLEAIRGHLAPATTTPTITIEQDAEIPSIEPTPEFVKIRTVFPPLELEERPIDDVRRLRVAVVGAGVSGITAGILFPVKVPKVDLVIYERESDVGGVWHANIYPGVRCDVPAHAYQATFEPSTIWSTAYTTGAEIKSYWKKVVEKYDVGRCIKFNSVVRSAEWSEEKSKWLVTTESNDPILPKYPGMDEFEGHLRHSSNWDPNFDPNDKRIAVIGNGASGLQVLPPLQKVATHIDHYARNKIWVAAPIGGENFEQFVADRIEKARTNPEEYLKFRKELEVQLFSRFGGIFKGGDKNNTAREIITKLMATRLGDRDDLLKRFASTADNVQYVTTPIDKFTRTGIQTIDVHREVDAVICRTGHDITFSTTFPVIANGVNLQTAWRPGGNPGFLDSYLSTAAPGFPNFLILLGPNATGPAGTLCHSVENQVTYAAKRYCESFFPRTVMSEYCSSWYNGGIKGGRIHGLWPGSASHVNLVRREPRWEDWKYTYLSPQGNRFAWLGNGWTTKDVAAASAKENVDIDLTPWLQADALGKGVDLRGYHENWWDA